MRTTPIVKSLAQPLLVKGCAYDVVMAALALALAVLIVCFIAGHALVGMGLGLALFATLFNLGRKLAARDPQLLSILGFHATWKRHGDSMKHVDRRLEVR